MYDALAAGLPLDVLLDQVEADAGIAARHAATAFVAGLFAEPRGAAHDETERKAVSSVSDAIRWRAVVPGAVVEFEAQEALARWFQQLLPFDQAATGAPRARFRIACVGGTYSLALDEAEILRTPDANLLLGRIYQACLELLHDRPRWRALIHGAAVALDGHAVGFPARSGSGKSTLSAWLVAQGFTYLSDDLLAVLDDGRVAPWPTPISVKPGSVEPLGSAYPGLAIRPIHKRKGVETRWLPLAEAQCADVPVPLHALVFPTYDPQGDGRLHALRPLDALARLASDRLWLGYPLETGRVAAFLDWLTGMPAFELRFASLDAAHRAIRALLAREDG